MDPILARGLRRLLPAPAVGGLAHPIGAERTAVAAAAIAGAVDEDATARRGRAEAEPVPAVCADDFEKGERGHGGDLVGRGSSRHRVVEHPAPVVVPDELRHGSRLADDAVQDLDRLQFALGLERLPQAAAEGAEATDIGRRDGVGRGLEAEPAEPAYEDGLVSDELGRRGEDIPRVHEVDGELEGGRARRVAGHRSLGSLTSSVPNTSNGTDVSVRPVLFALLLAAAFAAGCGGRGGGEAEAPAPSQPQTTAGETTPAADADLFEYEESSPLAVEVKATVRRGSVKVEDVTFAAPSGKTAAYLVRPAGKGPFAGALFLHWYDPASQTSNRSEFLEEAIALAGAGIVSILPEQRFPWHEGPSGPLPDREAVVAQVVDLRRALDVLVQQPGVEADRIAVVGHDYGGMHGSLLARFDRRPTTYVLMAVDADFPNWFVKYFVRSASMAEYEAAFAGLEPVEAVAEAAPASVFLQFAEADQYVPIYVTDELFEAASEPKRMELYGGGHELDAAARRDRVAWLRERLGLP
jgi:pimeloyl-ACP methyl ester carboxylesterase